MGSIQTEKWLFTFQDDAVRPSAARGTMWSIFRITLESSWYTSNYIFLFLWLWYLFRYGVSVGIFRYCDIPESNHTTWWRHQLETFSALLAICAGKMFPFDDVIMLYGYFLRLNKRLSKQSWGWWFETLPCPLWRHRNELPTSPCTPSWWWVIWHHGILDR